MRLTTRGLLIRLNILALLPMAGSALLLSGFLILYHNAGAPLVIDALPANLPNWLGTLSALVVLPLHEWVHGLMIRRCGYTPRFGAKWFVLFATANGALFTRNAFIRVALAPLVAITLGGIGLMLFLPEGIALWVGLAVVINAAGTVGDLWMTLVALRFPPSALIQDCADSMCIYMQTGVPFEQPTGAGI